MLSCGLQYLVSRYACNLFKPGRIVCKPPKEHGNSLSREHMRRLAQHPGNATVDKFIVERVTILMQCGIHRAIRRFDITRDTHVTLAVDVGAIGVLIFSCFFEQVVAFDKIIDRQVESGEILLCQSDNILVMAERIKINSIDFWCFLKEAVLIMLGHELFCRRLVPFGKLDIHIGFQPCKGGCGQFVEFIEKCLDLSWAGSRSLSISFIT